MFFLNKYIIVVEKRKHDSDLMNVRISSKSSENNECRSKAHEQKIKWNSCMNRCGVNTVFSSY